MAAMQRSWCTFFITLYVYFGIRLIFLFSSRSCRHLIPFAHTHTIHMRIEREGKDKSRWQPGTKVLRLCAHNRSFFCVHSGIALVSVCSFLPFSLLYISHADAILIISITHTYYTLHSTTTTTINHPTENNHDNRT